LRHSPAPGDRRRSGVPGRPPIL